MENVHTVFGPKQTVSGQKNQEHILLVLKCFESESYTCVLYIFTLKMFWGQKYMFLDFCPKMFHFGPKAVHMYSIHISPEMFQAILLYLV